MSILILTDFPAEGDEGYFTPAAHSFLRSSLSIHGIKLDELLTLPVLPHRPQKGDLAKICGPKDEGIKGKVAILKKSYISNTHAVELERTAKLIAAAKPNVILALGLLPLWFLHNTTQLRNIRGTTFGWSHNCETYKVLPTFHPSSIFKDWSLRPIFSADLHKVSIESAFKEVVRPSRKIWLEPTIEDLVRFEEEHISQATQLSVDIENSGEFLTCIGFAPSPHLAIVVPFTSKADPNWHYWKSTADEIVAAKWVRKICSLPITKIGQNIIYDINFLFTQYNIPMLGKINDTMLLHHALQPELKKGLGFLGSVYTLEPPWKFMRHDNETAKRED